MYCLPLLHPPTSYNVRIYILAVITNIPRRVKWLLSMAHQWYEVVVGWQPVRGNGRDTGLAG